MRKKRDGLEQAPIKREAVAAPAGSDVVCIDLDDDDAGVSDAVVVIQPDAPPVKSEVKKELKREIKAEKDEKKKRHKKSKIKREKVDEQAAAGNGQGKKDRKDDRKDDRKEKDGKDKEKDKKDKKDKDNRKRSRSRKRSSSTTSSSSSSESSMDEAEMYIRLRPYTKVQLVGLVRKADLNGMSGMVVHPSCAVSPCPPGCMLVRLDTGREIAVKPANLEPLQSFHVGPHQAQHSREAHLKQVLKTIRLNPDGGSDRSTTTTVAESHAIIDDPAKGPQGGVGHML